MLVDSPICATEPISNKKTFENLNLKEMSELEEAPKKMKSKSQYTGTYCCVGNCNARTGRESLQFFQVIRKKAHTKETTKFWTDAIRTTRSINKEGTEWYPTKNTIICAQHFVSGAPCNGKAIESRNDTRWRPVLFDTR